MTLQEFYNQLDFTASLVFALPEGRLVPAHFHITEVGQIDRFFVDCGGTVRKESAVNLQMYTAQDFDHRLTVPKLKSIIEMSIQQLQLRGDSELRVEYQGATIEVYGLSHNGYQFILQPLQTDCLAKTNAAFQITSQKRLCRHPVHLVLVAVNGYSMALCKASEPPTMGSVSPVFLRSTVSLVPALG